MILVIWKAGPLPIYPLRRPGMLRRTNLLLDVVEGIGRVNRETDQDDMGVRV